MRHRGLGPFFLLPHVVTADSRRRRESTPAIPTRAPDFAGARSYCPCYASPCRAPGISRGTGAMRDGTCEAHGQEPPLDTLLTRSSALQGVHRACVLDAACVRLSVRAHPAGLVWGESWQSHDVSSQALCRNRSSRRFSPADCRLPRESKSLRLTVLRCRCGP